VANQRPKLSNRRIALLGVVGTFLAVLVAIVAIVIPAVEGPDPPELTLAGEEASLPGSSP
jgi:hypothetical protein